MKHTSPETQAKRDAKLKAAGLIATDTRDVRIRPLASVTFDEQLGREVDWRMLPKSPIAGFDLRECGLYDIEHKVPLTANEMRMMINELARLEGSAMYNAEGRFAGSGIQRVNDASLLLGPVVFVAAAGYFFCNKFLSAYDSAYPYNSQFVKKWAYTRMEHRDLERFCMKYRTALNVTNARPLFFLSVSVFLLWCAKTLYPARHGESSFDVTTRESLAWFQHVEKSLKWAYTVYNAHPAYRDEHIVDVDTGSKADKHNFQPLPVLQSKRHLLNELDRLEAQPGGPSG
jgi:hypothetical protein